MTNVIFLENKNNSCNAFDVLQQNGFVPDNKELWDANWSNGTVKVRISHPVWEGKKVMVKIL